MVRIESVFHLRVSLDSGTHFTAGKSEKVPVIFDNMLS